MVCPFIQRDALRELFSFMPPMPDLKIITRWNQSDLASGVSDISIYEECKSKRIPLYTHNSIHLKLLLTASGTCFMGSSNITKKGLGLIPSANVEAGTWIDFSCADWEQIYRLIDNSRLVDDDYYKAACSYVEECAQAPAHPVPQFAPPSSSTQEFTIGALPATLGLGR